MPENNLSFKISLMEKASRDNNGLATIEITSFNSNGLNISNMLVTADIAAVPLPASMWLFGSGLIGLAGVMRRKNMT